MWCGFGSNSYSFYSKHSGRRFAARKRVGYCQVFGAVAQGYLRASPYSRWALGLLAPPALRLSGGAFDENYATDYFVVQSQTPGGSRLGGFFCVGGYLPLEAVETHPSRSTNSRSMAIQAEKSASSVYFLPLPVLFGLCFACAKSEPASSFSFFVDFGSRRAFAASEATFFPVVMIVLGVERTLEVNMILFTLSNSKAVLRRRP